MKVRATVLALLLTAALALPASAETIKVSGSGQDLWQQVKAKTLNDTTYVSLRSMSQILSPGAQVSWSDESYTAYVKGSGVTLAAAPGSCYLTVNDRALYIRDKVLLENGSVLVPIRVLAEALGGSVDWSRERGVVLTVGNGRPGAAPYTADELYWMSRIISAESQGEPLLGKLAVGSVILNRVASSEFPNTIYDVIFDRKWGVQFTPVANGTIYNAPTQESVLAAKLCLEGISVVEDSLYFLAPELATNFWIMANRDYVTAIGCHWFYR